MVELEINDTSVEVSEGSTVMEAAEKLGVFIPHFCYHKKLSIAANCRMCLVEVAKSRKPLPACATPVTHGMKVFTNSKIAKDAQQGVMEFLLINHPLDCPICDQGGECQLQDLAVGYGNSNSRFEEEKRVVFHKSMGPLISSEEMSRCIHCTRCVRFGEELAGIKELGMPGRGEHSEIMTYLDGAIESELSGNMIDICPVGALTSKPFRYTARTWELDRVKTISPHDALGANLIAQTKDNVIKRVVPYENESVNECWISDRDRFSYEAFNIDDRLQVPMIKDDNGEWQTVDWKKALLKVEEIIKSGQKKGKNGVRTFVSSMCSVEDFLLAGEFTRSVGSDCIDFRSWLSDSTFDKSMTGSPYMEFTLSDISNLDSILIIGSRLRDDCPLLAQKLRVGVNRFGLKISQLNAFRQDLLTDEKNSFLLSSDKWIKFLSALLKYIKREDTKTSIDENILNVKDFASELLDAKDKSKILILVGPSVFAHKNASIMLSLTKSISEILGCHISYLPSGGNYLGGYYSKALPINGGLNSSAMFDDMDASFLLVNSEPTLDFPNSEKFEKISNAIGVIALTSYKSTVSSFADVMLPIATYMETEGSYINLEGLVQHSGRAVEAPGEARPIWKIFRVLGSMFSVKNFDFNTIKELRNNFAPELHEEKKLKIQPLEIISNVNFNEEHILKKNNFVSEIFHYFPIYLSDLVVRRAPSLQKTKQSQRPKAFFNPEDFINHNFVSGEKIDIEVESKNVYSFECDKDVNVAKGTVAVACGHLMSKNISGSIFSLSIKKQK